MKSHIPLHQRPWFQETLQYVAFVLATLLAIIALCSGCDRQQAVSSRSLQQEARVV